MRAAFRTTWARMHRYFDLLYSKYMDAMLELIDDDIEWLAVTVFRTLW